MTKPVQICWLLKHAAMGYVSHARTISHFDIDSNGASKRHGNFSERMLPARLLYRSNNILLSIRYPVFPPDNGRGTQNAPPVSGVESPGCSADMKFLVGCAFLG